MNKILKSALVLSIIASSSYAGCNATECIGKIETLYMTATGTLYVGTDGDETRLACGGVSGVYMSLKEGDVGKNAMYSLLLTAKTTDKAVKIRAEDTTDCRVVYVTTVD